MTAYLDLLPEVLPDVPGCSDTLAERAIRDAVIRLCELSDIIKRTMGPFDIEADEPNYPIVVEPNYTYNQVLWVSVAGSPPLNGVSQDQLDLGWRDANARRPLFSHYHALGFTDEASGWRSFKQHRPQAYFIERQNGVDTLRLVGIPESSIAEGLQYQLSLKPLRSSTDVEDFVAEDYYRLIAKGALGMLLQISKKAWTDLVRGRELWSEFESECLDVKRSSLKDFTRDDHAHLRTRAYP